MRHTHQPMGAARAWIGLTHGAGSNCDTALLRALGDALAAASIGVLRYDLPFRESGAKGPPRPADAARDRQGIAALARELRELAAGAPVLLGGHSYGGRQTTMLAAEDPGAADGLLLMSYPLHPPGKPDQLRTAHFSSLLTPALFIHGDRDPFGSPEEMMEHVPLTARIEIVPGAGHELARPAAVPRLAAHIAALVVEHLPVR
ncbi:MAG: alpha/beta fold hydrolase [Acidobacteria bacterium]|nr:alpha/beta fold hydrolase [Acidobacteriota bacterium]